MSQLFRPNISVVGNGGGHAPPMATKKAVEGMKRPLVMPSNKGPIDKNTNSKDIPKKPIEQKTQDRGTKRKQDSVLTKNTVNSQDDSEDSNDDNSAIGSDTEVDSNNNDEGTDNNEGVTNEQVEILLKKPRVARNVFTEEMLVSNLGLDLMYETFPKTCRLRGRGFEAADLKNLIANYKGWAFQLFPGLSFADMLLRIQSFGQKSSVRARMQALREKERNRYLREVMGVEPTVFEAKTESTTEPADREDFANGEEIEFEDSSDEDSISGDKTSPEASRSPDIQDKSLNISEEFDEEMFY